MDAGYSSDSENRKLARERCNHDLLKSEDEYVNMLEVIVQYIFKPLQQNAIRCKIKPKHVQFVFVFLEHMLQFHMNFLGVIREAISVVPDFYKYSNFISMYEDYLKKYDEIIRVFASWRSMEFREFVRLRLQNDKVKKHIESPNLSTLPWYLYRPFDRVKEYYRFLKDLDQLSKKKDEDRDFLIKSLARFKPVYRKIKQSEERLQTKTRLLEVQLQIHGDYKSIVSDDRYFLFQKPCQMKRKLLGKRFKRITIYVCSDLFIWVSARGRYKGSYSLYDPKLDLGIPKNAKKGDGEFFIGLKSEKTKRLIVCASDVQRDRILGKIQDAYRRCQEKADAASPEQRETIRKRLARDTRLAPEMSQSSMDVSMDIDQSVSMSASEQDPRPPAKQNYQLGLRKISEGRTTDDGDYKDENGLMAKNLHSPNLAYSDAGDQSPAASVSIAITNEPPTPLEDSMLDGTHNGNQTHNTGLVPIQEVKDGKTEREHGNAKMNGGSHGNAKKEAKKNGSSSAMNGSSSHSHHRSKREREREGKEHKEHGSSSRSKHRHHHSHHSRRKRTDDKSTEELKARVKELEELIKRKDERIQTLEMSNQSIRNTMFVTRNQLIRAQQENENLKKRFHPRTHSLGMPSAMHEFRKLRQKTTGMLSPRSPAHANGGPSSFPPVSEETSTDLKTKFRKSYPLRRASSQVGIRYFRQ